MNRKQRRAAARKQPLAMPMSQQKLIAGMYKNGITEKDLKDEFYKGVEAGRRATIKTVYAAAICAAKDILELEKEKLWELIQGVDHHVCNTLSSEEIIDRVLRETGISLNFSDPFETVEITE